MICSSPSSPVRAEWSKVLPLLQLTYNLLTCLFGGFLLQETKLFCFLNGHFRSFSFRVLKDKLSIFININLYVVDGVGPLSACINCTSNPTISFAQPKIKLEGMKINFFSKMDAHIGQFIPHKCIFFFKENYFKLLICSCRVNLHSVCEKFRVFREAFFATEL